jgi:phosphoheptose isomerase
MTEIAHMTTAQERRVLFVRDRPVETAGVFHRAADSPLPARLEEAAAAIANAFESGHKLLVFGNGGSASDAQHLCGELVVRFQMTRRPLRFAATRP